jgi:thiamine transport system substrate-binding protein
MALVLPKLGRFTFLLWILICSHAVFANELRVLVHSSFSLPKPLVTQFEAQTNAKLLIIKAGDAGEMLNKLILTKAQPIADVVYGLDNTLAAKAASAKVLTPYKGAATQRATLVGLDQSDLIPINYGYVTLNYDKRSFAKSGLALPLSLDDLTLPAYRGMLVVQNPATSSAGYAMLLATIAHKGETAAFEWWALMRANGMKVSKGWSEAYYTDFSRNGGKYPIVVSYVTSPAAEVFFSKEKITEPPTANLFLKGAVFRQVEGIGLVQGGLNRELAQLFIEFMRSAAVQEALQTSMWMFPVEVSAPRAAVMQHAPEPANFERISSEVIAAQGAQWISRWTRLMR